MTLIYGAFFHLIVGLYLFIYLIVLTLLNLPQNNMDINVLSWKIGVKAMLTILA